MKTFLSNIFKYFGLNVSKWAKTGYEDLLHVPRYQETTLTLLGKPFTIADSHSFYYSYKEIFLDEIYEFTVRHGNNPKILDCGSNYGTSVVYFKHLYPNATITAVEADPIIYKRLLENITKRNYRDVTIINKALSDTLTPVMFNSEGADGGRIHPIDNPKNTYKVLPIKLDDLIDGTVDFLKMDIEGAETDVLCNSEKLDKVHQLFIEYHSFLGADQSLAQLLSKLTSTGFRYYIQSQFCSKKPFIKIETQLGMDLQLNIFAIRV
jgi:FkbM family methyltransferase